MFYNIFTLLILSVFIQFDTKTKVLQSSTEIPIDYKWLKKNKTCKCKNLKSDQRNFNIKIEYVFRPSIAKVNNKYYFKVKLNDSRIKSTFTAYIRIEDDIIYWLDEYWNAKNLFYQDKVNQEQVFLNFKTLNSSWDLYTNTEMIGASKITLTDIKEIKEEKIYTFKLKNIHLNDYGSDYIILKEMQISNKKGFLNFTIESSTNGLVKCK